MTRRSTVKWLHWASLGFLLYFFVVEPEDVQRLGAAALATHAGVGLLLGIVSVVWTVMFLSKGLLSRPGPKLPGWARQLHPLSHRALYFGLPATVATGALAGFAAPYVIRAFGVLPINPGWGTRGLHGVLEEIHEIAFDLMMIAVVLHAVFHLWRHFGLRDNALRIMVPKVLHKYL